MERRNSGMGRNTRWLILIPAITFALFAKPAKADVLGEWTYSQSCATGSVEVVNNSIILHGPDGGGCQGPNWVKIVTTIPADVNTINFTWAYQTNDGAWYDPPQYGVNGVYTQLTMQSNATGSASISVNEGDIFTFRQYSTDSCCQPGHLTISNLSLWAYITASTTTMTTTTTTVPETTVPATAPTTTTVQDTTTLLATTTTTPTTTSTEQTVSTTTPPTLPQTTQPISVETSVPTTLPETTTSTTSTTAVATTITVTLPPSTTSTTSTSSIPPTTTIAPESPQTTLPAVLSDVTPTQALSVALASETLQTLTASQATEIFASLPIDELSDTQIAEITAAVQNAPTEVRQAFEQKVDIFKAGFDDYVPVGSNIPVGTRRTLIAITAGITLAAAGTRIRR